LPACPGGVDAVPWPCETEPVGWPDDGVVEVVDDADGPAFFA